MMRNSGLAARRQTAIGRHGVVGSVRHASRPGSVGARMQCSCRCGPGANADHSRASPGGVMLRDGAATPRPPVADEPDREGTMATMVRIHGVAVRDDARRGGPRDGIDACEIDHVLAAVIIPQKCLGIPRTFGPTSPATRSAPARPGASGNGRGGGHDRCIRRGDRGDRQLGPIAPGTPHERDFWETLCEKGGWFAVADQRGSRIQAERDGLGRKR